MQRTTTHGILHTCVIRLLFAGGIFSLIFIYLTSDTTRSSPVPVKAAPHTHSTQERPDKPVLLLWFWPENHRFPPSDCKTLFDIDGCVITGNRSKYGEADAVLIFHKAIRWDLSNLPSSPRSHFQKWIWFNVESPTNTAKKQGLQNLFNLTLSYRQDADIPARYRLTTKKHPGEDFVLPPKNKLVCWIVSNKHPRTGAMVRNRYYRELSKHIKVHIYGKAFGRFLKYEDFYPTISSCKFYLSFENTIHRDYITEKLNGPLAVGTVPVVLGPPRQNYEDFVPGDSFIHVNDFKSPKELADYLLKLGQDEEAYLRYFQWRRYLTAKPHPILKEQEFLLAICTACDYIAKHHEYKATHDIYKWYFS